jgi:triphosphatase
MSEIELKFLLDEPTAKRLWTRVRASQLASAAPVTKLLRSVYLDTAEHALRHAGIALRLRRDGRRWVQTVKTGRKIHGGLSQATELESPAPGGRVNLDAIPDDAVREDIVQRINGGALQPVCETLIKRTAGEVALQDGTRVELAVDVGEIRADGRSAELREAEIELLEGSPAKLFDVARALFPEGGLSFSRLSKSARGYLLAERGYIEPPLEPRNAETVALEPQQMAETAARDVLRECVDQVAANVVVVTKLDDPEGPHQLRVGLRRLRSAFAVFGAVLDSPEMERLKGEARWLGQEVGALRDLDVVAGEIARREAMIHPDEPSLTQLADALDGAAADRRRRLTALLHDERAQTLVLDLVRFVETRGWLVSSDFEQTARLAGSVDELATAALDKAWKKTRKQARDVATLNAEQRHELRKELKQLRYAAEFFAPLYSTKRCELFLKRLKKLQDVFGELNDAMTVRAMFAGPDASPVDGPGTDAARQRAIGWMIGASQARAERGWTGAKQLWKELAHTKPFWRGD